MITIDGKEYELSDLSDEARAQLQSLQATEVRIAQTQQELAMMQTARNAYATALKTLLSDLDADDDEDEDSPD